MDLRTGRTYPTRDDAERDGVPSSDIAHVETTHATPGQLPRVTFSKNVFGRFKSETSTAHGQR